MILYFIKISNSDRVDLDKFVCVYARNFIKKVDREGQVPMIRITPFSTISRIYI